MVTEPRERASFFRLIAEGTGFLVLALIAGGLVISLLRSSHSYGPDAAQDVRLTVAPGVSVELLPGARSLDSAVFANFDVSPGGAVLVGDGTQVFDLASGEPLLPDRHVRSFAFAGGGLALLRSDGKLGYFDGTSFHAVGDAPHVESGLVSSTDYSRLLLHRQSADDTGTAPAVVEFREGAAPRNLTGSFTPIAAVAGDAFQTYFAERNALYQLVSPGSPTIILTLPSVEQNILGIAVDGSATYFATDSGVYLLREGMAIPLVLGIGGRLRVSGEHLFVLSSRTGRIYRITMQAAAGSG